MLFDVRQCLLVSSRRLLVTEFFRASAMWGLVAVFSAHITPPGVRADETQNTRSIARPSACRDIRIILEAVGELRLNADGKKISTLPLKVTGTLHYEERQLSSSDATSAESRRTDFIRRYQEARAKIVVGDSESDEKLSPDRSIIVAHVKDNEQELFSPLGP